MQSDIQLEYRDAIDASHHGHPTVVHVVPTGGRGRPRIVIDREFLQWAYSQRTTASIHRFLGVSRDTVRRALLEYGIVSPQADPFLDGAELPPHEDEALLPDDDLLEPNVTIPAELPLPIDIEQLAQPYVISFTGPLSTISDDELDLLVGRLRSHFRRAGLAMLDGMLRRLGHRVPRERIRQCLLRIDPVRRIFERIRIRRRNYSVPGPNSLWHHDGQHGEYRSCSYFALSESEGWRTGLIRWGIVIHGFIDGYSRLVTGLRASDNNRAATVLEIFLASCGEYGVPSRLRGDHGTENLYVAAWMEVNRGLRRGSYIWGRFVTHHSWYLLLIIFRSVHNVRIERLWVDVTVQVGATWSERFTIFEIRHGLDINNVNHVWLLHFLFLSTINSQLAFFAQSWNQHRIQIRRGPNRSPADMFVFDMLVNGVRGNQLPEDDISEEELEVYGIDWEGLRDDALLESQRNNNPAAEGATSWVGRVGPPALADLSSVVVEPPPGTLGDAEVNDIYNAVQHLLGSADDDDCIAAWSIALSYVRVLRPDIF